MTQDGTRRHSKAREDTTRHEKIGKAREDTTTQEKYGKAREGTGARARNVSYSSVAGTFEVLSLVTVLFVLQIKNQLDSL